MGRLRLETFNVDWVCAYVLLWHSPCFVPIGHPALVSGLSNSVAAIPVLAFKACALLRLGLMAPLSTSWARINRGNHCLQGHKSHKCDQSSRYSNPAHAMHPSISIGYLNVKESAKWTDQTLRNGCVN
jgi:hypothetical protein